MTELLDLLGRRWALRVLWELRDGEAQSFRALRAACDAMSPSVLSERLEALREAGVVDAQEPGGYVLTREGRELVALLAPLQGWGERWARGRG